MAKRFIPVLYKKSDICNALGCNYHDLDRHKQNFNEVELNLEKRGSNYFTDLEVFKIIKFFRPLLTDMQIKTLIRPDFYGSLGE